MKTLQQLMDESRRIAALTGDSDSVEDPTLVEYVNQGIAELYDLIIDADDGRIFAKNAPNPPKIGDHSYRLPKDLYRLISVHVLRGAHYVPAMRAQSEEMPELADNRTTYTQPRYFHRWDFGTGEQFVFVYPTPDTDTLAITYFPRPPRLEEMSDAIDNPAEWASFVTYTAAVKMLMQLERDASAQLIELKRTGQRIQDAISDLDMNSPAIVRDIEGKHVSGWGQWGLW